MPLPQLEDEAEQQQEQGGGRWGMRGMWRKGWVANMVEVGVSRALGHGSGVADWQWSLV